MGGGGLGENNFSKNFGRSNDNSKRGNFKRNHSSKNKIKVIYFKTNDHPRDQPRVRYDKDEKPIPKEMIPIAFSPTIDPADNPTFT